MSLVRGKFRFLSIRPRLRATPDRLTIQTAWITRLITLGLSLRRVEIDTAARRVDINTRTAWLFTGHHRIGFDELSHLDYTYHDFGTSYGWAKGGLGRHDQVERFTISLVTRDETTHTICSFRGEGAVQTGWFGVLVGKDSWLDLSGTQEQDSRRMAEMLSNVLAIPLGKPVAMMGDKQCSACGRRARRGQRTCLYCGGSIVA